MILTNIKNKMEITNAEQDILIYLIENEIESDVSYLDDIKGKEKEFYKNHILKLKDILIKLKPIEVCML